MGDVYALPVTTGMIRRLYEDYMMLSSTVKYAYHALGEFKTALVSYPMLSMPSVHWGK